MTASFEGLHVVLTGAASGIGHETALLLADAGARITAVDRNAPTAPVAAFHQCNLADPASIDAVAAAIDGPVDALINVAGVPGTAEPEIVMSVNLFGLDRFTQAILPKIPAGGCVTHVASIAGNGWMGHLAEINDLLDTMAEGGFAGGLAWVGEHPRSGAESYNYSKECVIVLTKRQSRWLKDHGVRVNSVSPGVVETPILVDFVESMGKDMIDFSAGVVGRHSKPIEQARCVVAITDPALGWVNGHDFICDGGMMASVFGGWMAG